MPPSAGLLEAPDDPTCGVMVIPNCRALVIQCREGPEFHKNDIAFAIYLLGHILILVLGDIEQATGKI
jgi:hypothetical protein